MTFCAVYGFIGSQQFSGLSFAILRIGGKAGQSGERDPAALPLHRGSLHLAR
jgi:hypothetical protein